MIPDPIARRFLSEEDLELMRLTPAEFARLSLAAFRAAQATNSQDEHIYSSGCLAVEPGYEHLLPMIRTGSI